MTQVSKRHPSRDPRPAEWENVNFQNERGEIRSGINLHPGGALESRELELATRQAVAFKGIRRPGFSNEPGPDMSHLTEPSQGRLFDPERLQGRNRVMLGRQQVKAEAGTNDREMMDDFISKSEIPTSHLQGRRDISTGQEMQPTIGTSKNLHIGEKGGAWDLGWPGTNAAGWYQGGATPERQDIIAMNPSGRGSETFVHEMGHRRHLGNMLNPNPLVSHPNNMNPDPLKEGVADAYVDRYGGSEENQVREMQKDIEYTGQKFPSYQYTGYSSLHHSWSPTERAVYTAVRGHASETGEQSFYKPTEALDYEYPQAAKAPSDPTLDATLHHLTSTSPHAVEALEQNYLKDVGDAAFRRHRDRQLMHHGQEVQHGLFDEIRSMDTGRVYGYTPSAAAHPGPTEDYDTGHYHDMDRADALADAAGDVAWPEHMSHNQFGEPPRSARDVGITLGVSRRKALSRGFS